MDINFDDKPTDYATVPPGSYLCEITEVREGTTRTGAARWSLRLTVMEGEYIGRLAAWDNLILSTRGLVRARHVLAALGLPHEGRVQLEPGDLEGRQAFVEVRPVEYTSPSGLQVRRNEVPYEGYRPIDGAESNHAEPTNGHRPAPSTDEEIPPDSIPF